MRKAATDWGIMNIVLSETERLTNSQNLRFLHFLIEVWEVIACAKLKEAQVIVTIFILWQELKQSLGTEVQCVQWFVLLFNNNLPTDQDCKSILHSLGFIRIKFSMASTWTTALVNTTNETLVAWAVSVSVQWIF